MGGLNVKVLLLLNCSVRFLFFWIDGRSQCDICGWQLYFYSCSTAIVFVPIEAFPPSSPDVSRIMSVVNKKLFRLVQDLRTVEKPRGFYENKDSSSCATKLWSRTRWNWWHYWKRGYVLRISSERIGYLTSLLWNHIANCSTTACQHSLREDRSRIEWRGGKKW